MTKLIDGDRLEAYLSTQTGLDSLLIQLVLNDFVYTPPKTPISEINVPAKLKVQRHGADTSWEAAYMQSAERSRPLFRAIYRALTQLGPLTDDELTRHLGDFIRQMGYSANSVRKRRGELKEAGWVRATDLRRKSDAGASMIVWEAVEEDN